VKRFDEIHKIMKYREDDMLVELLQAVGLSVRNLPSPSARKRQRRPLLRVESERGDAKSEITSLRPLPDFYCLSRTVRAGAADGPRPYEFRQSAFPTGLSSS
jgi:hypothetical protein